MSEADITTRNDLKCSKCGETFTGTISQDECPSCEEDVEIAELKKEEADLGRDEVAVVVDVPEGEEPNFNYRKRVKVDADGEQNIRKRAGRKKAKKKGSPVPTESKEQRARKRPLRAKLEELKREESELSVRLAEIRAERGKVVSDIEADPEGHVRDCYGSFDPNDYDCASLCPLRVECRAK